MKETDNRNDDYCRWSSAVATVPTYIIQDRILCTSGAEVGGGYLQGAGQSEGGFHRMAGPAGGEARSRSPGRWLGAASSQGYAGGRQHVWSRGREAITTSGVSVVSQCLPANLLCCTKYCTTVSLITRKAAAGNPDYLSRRRYDYIITRDLKPHKVLIARSLYNCVCCPVGYRNAGKHNLYTTYPWV